MEEARRNMIEVLKNYGIQDQQILDVMQETPRHLFIPTAYRDQGDPYGNHPCSIGYKQTISQPYIVAYMTEKMAIQPGEKVLEIGTGSGYQAAILDALNAEVYSIEIIPELAEHAKAALKETGHESVQLLTGDGYKGWPEQAPFDVILVTCAPADLPDALMEQLAENGRMILPVGAHRQRLVILRKQHGEIIAEDDLPVRFVPMVHDQE